MSKRTVHVVGTGTIGEPLIGLLADYQKELGIDEITFSKRSALLTDRSKVVSLMKRGAKLCAPKESWSTFEELDMKPSYSFDEALEKASVVVDCTPVGNANKEEYYSKHLSGTSGFIAQGSEFGFGKMYARGINDNALAPGEDHFIQVVSCNTHNLAVLIQALGMENTQTKTGFESGRFVCIRRSNDISQDSGFSPGPSTSKHKEGKYGTHHARDAHELFKTLDFNYNIFSSALKIPTQYMHTVWFHLTLKDPISKEEALNALRGNDRVALTHKNSANSVFSFGRDHGHFGRILNQTVVVEASVEVINEREVVGWCFTPQDGNSLLSSVAAAEFFLYPEDYANKIQCLSRYFFSEV